MDTKKNLFNLLRKYYNTVFAHKIKITPELEKLAKQKNFNIEEINKQISFDTKERWSLMEKFNNDKKLLGNNKILSGFEIDDNKNLCNKIKSLGNDTPIKYILNVGVFGNRFGECGIIGSHCVPLYIIRKDENLSIVSVLDERQENVGSICNNLVKFFRENPSVISELPVKNISFFPIINFGERIQSDQHNCHAFAINALDIEEDKIRKHIDTVINKTIEIKILENAKISNTNVLGYCVDNMDKILKLPPILSESVVELAQSQIYLKKFDIEKPELFTAELESENDTNTSKANPNAYIENNLAKRYVDYINREVKGDGKVNKL